MPGLLMDVPEGRVLRRSFQNMVAVLELGEQAVLKVHSTYVYIHMLSHNCVILRLLFDP